MILLFQAKTKEGHWRWQIEGINEGNFYRVTGDTGIGERARARDLSINSRGPLVPSSPMSHHPLLGSRRDPAIHFISTVITGQQHQPKRVGQSTGRSIREPTVARLTITAFGTCENFRGHANLIATTVVDLRCTGDPGIRQSIDGSTLYILFDLQERSGQWLLIQRMRKNFQEYADCLLKRL